MPSELAFASVRLVPHLLDATRWAFAESLIATVATFVLYVPFAVLVEGCKGFLHVASLAKFQLGPPYYCSL